MPGRCEPIQQVWDELRRRKVKVLVNLAEPDEVRKKSPEYASVIEANAIPCQYIAFPIEDYGVPQDQMAFWNLALQVATALKEGSNVLVHCAAGIGRTGTAATAVLVALGLKLADAERAVRDAGSHPEKCEQRELLAWCATRAKS